MCFYLCLVGGFPEGDSHHWLFFLGFLLESGQRPLAGQTWIQNLSQLLKYQSTCNKKVSQKTKNLQIKNQRFQSRRLTTDHATICQAWPRPARSFQILAIKKEKLRGVLATSTNYREPSTNLSGGSGLHRRRHPKSGIHFFRLPVFTEPKVLLETVNAQTKNLEIFLRVGN